MHWRVVPVAGDRPVASFQVDGLPGLEFTALATRAPPLPHLAHTEGPRVGDSIALAVRDLATGQRVFCAPGLVQLGETELAWMHEADCLLLDNLLPGPHDIAAAAAAATPPAWLEVLRQLPARHKLLFGDASNEAAAAGWAGMGLGPGAGLRRHGNRAVSHHRRPLTQTFAPAGPRAIRSFARLGAAATNAAA